MTSRSAIGPEKCGGGTELPRPRDAANSRCRHTHGSTASPGGALSRCLGFFPSFFCFAAQPLAPCSGADPVRSSSSPNTLPPPPQHTLCSPHLHPPHSPAGKCSLGCNAMPLRCGAWVHHHSGQHWIYYLIYIIKTWRGGGGGGKWCYLQALCIWRRDARGCNGGEHSASSSSRPPSSHLPASPAQGAHPPSAHISSL